MFQFINIFKKMTPLSPTGGTCSNLLHLPKIDETIILKSHVVVTWVHLLVKSETWLSSISSLQSSAATYELKCPRCLFWAEVSKIEFKLRRN